MALNVVDSSGVSQEVMQAVQNWREQHADYYLTNFAGDGYYTCGLEVDMAVNRRGAEYIVECLGVHLQEQHISEATALAFSRDEISDEAIDVFGGFLRETTTPCQHLVHLYMAHLPPLQFRRLLAALRSNTSVKVIVIIGLGQDEGAASWVADLLRHKSDNSTDFYLYDCGFSLTQVIPLVQHGQQPQHLRREVGFREFHVGDHLLFNDPESTRLLIDNNFLLTPSTTLTQIQMLDCGIPTNNRPLMTGIAKKYHDV